jgi:pimeloyl-ACP methyl ester carboxylesterase
VVICNPFGQEYLRAHRSLLQLADRLGAAGFHVLRFDYFGCGDSAGEEDEGRLERWVRDAALAVEEIEALSAVPKVALVGLRLGATLAARLATRQPGVEHLVLWDPVLDGRDYLEELTAADDVWMREHARVRPGRVPQQPQRLGFPLPDALRDEIMAADANVLAGGLAGHTLLLATEGGSGEASRIQVAAAAASGHVELESVPGPPVWLRGEADGLASALVPVEAIDRITAWLARKCA